ncbi:MAG: hypothetical protein KF830_03875 [Planctomycetes bacterium]|nr:hypothetical protein [Planctomycetota bacterium]
MHTTLVPILCLLTTSFAATQTATVRGKVEDVSGTTNQFVLDGTVLPLVSTALNLNAWRGQPAVLQVVNVGTAAAPVLRVDAAAPTTALMDMGNLRLGNTSTWEVTAPNGSFVLIAIDFTANTGFLPLDPFGTYLLGPNPYLLASGFTNAPDRFRVAVTVPPDQTLLDAAVTSQAIVGNPAGSWYFSDPDHKVVQP